MGRRSRKQRSAGTEASAIRSPAPSGVGQDAPGAPSRPAREQAARRAREDALRKAGRKLSGDDADAATRARQERGTRARGRAAASGRDAADAGVGLGASAERGAGVRAGRRQSRAATRREQAPEPPWGSFPLVEIAVLSAIALAVAGFFVGGRPGNVLLTGAVLMGSVAGLEVALREHIGGYRSHTLVLSAALAVATLALLFLLRVDRATMVPVAVGVLGLAFVGWRALFKKRSGGFGVKVR